MQAVTITQISLTELETLIDNSIGKLLKLHSSHQTNESNQYISIATASGLLSISRVTLYEYIKEGRLKKYKIGSTTRLLKSEVLSIVEPV